MRIIHCTPSDLQICRATRSQSLICVLLGGHSQLADGSFGNSFFLKADVAMSSVISAPSPLLAAIFFLGIFFTVHSYGSVFAAPIEPCCSATCSLYAPFRSSPAAPLPVPVRSLADLWKFQVPSCFLQRYYFARHGPIGPAT